MSKELTPLEALNKVVYCYGYDKNIEIIEKALKVLKIIKRNPVLVICEYQTCIVYKNMTYKEYCDYFPNKKDRNIKSQKECDLLKEILL